jgi:hypothetical protein
MSSQAIPFCDAARIRPPWRGRIVCAWCGKDMGPAKTRLDSHEICGTCKVKAMREADDAFRRDEALRQEEPAA